MIFNSNNVNHNVIDTQPSNRNPLPIKGREHTKKTQKTSKSKLFFEDRAHGEPTSTMTIAPVPANRTRAQTVTVVAAVGRRRPVVAARANVVEGTIVSAAIARRGEKHIRCVGSPQTTLVRRIPST